MVVNDEDASWQLSIGIVAMVSGLGLLFGKGMACLALGGFLLLFGLEKWRKRKGTEDDAGARASDRGRRGR